MKYLVPMIAFLAIGLVCAAQHADVDSWKTDLDNYQKTLEEKHIDLYHNISKKEFTSEIQRIKRKLPHLSNFQVIIELMKLTQKVGGGQGDGHTAVPLWGMELHRYPIKFFDFGEDLRVVEVKEEHSHLLGNKLLSIDGVPVEDIYNEVATLTPFTENKQSSMDRICSYMTTSELLYGLDVTKRKETARFTFVDDTGLETSVALEATADSDLNDLDYKVLSIGHPKIRQPDSSQVEGLWFTALDNDKTIYIRFRRYASSDAEMSSFSEGVYNYIEEHKSKYLIIDLRDNYGGDLFKGLLLAGWLSAADSIEWKSGVYVLIDRATYSAAMVNAAQFKQLLNARTVGEPTGANPVGYQDLGQFNLPRSNLLITYSKRIFRLQDTQTSGLQPDVLITPKVENYMNGMDEVLEWVLRDLNEKGSSRDLDS